MVWKVSSWMCYINPRPPGIPAQPICLRSNPQMAWNSFKIIIVMEAGVMIYATWTSPMHALCGRSPHPLHVPKQMRSGNHWGGCKTMKGCNIEVHLNIVKMEINAKHHRVRQYAIVQHHASNPKLNAYQTRGIFPSIFELFLLFYCGWIIWEE